MAIFDLKGEKISIQVKSEGAELFSLVDNESGQEYIWCGDPQFWGKTSPVLFPFVGRMKGLAYQYKGKTYQAPVHGFAREMEFQLVSQDSNSLWLEICDTKETREVYPFAFGFQIGYVLQGRTLKVLFRIKNNNEEKMYFSLGGHPAFACPLEKGHKRSDYFLKFDELDSIESNGVDISVGLVTNEYTKYSLDKGVLPITDHLFDQDALVIENYQVKEVSLLRPDRTPYVKFVMDAPIYGIWSSIQPGSPFVCIEPWFGRCDAVGFKGTLEEREWQQQLEAGEVFETEYSITV